MNQCDVVWADMPFSNMKRAKIRPAIVLSNNKYNKSSSDVILCSITSKLKEHPLNINIDQSKMETGRFEGLGMIKLDKIMQIHKSLVQRKIGVLNENTFSLVTSKIMELIER